MRFTKLTLLLSIVLVTSCKGTTFESWEIGNNCTDTIHGSYQDIANNTVETFQLSPNESLTIKTLRTDGESSTANKPSTVYSSFTVVNSTGTTSTKNVLTDNNWTIIEDIKKTPTKRMYYYLLNFQDSDF